MKKKKKDSIADEIREIEELNKEGEDRKFYQAMKKIKKDFQPRTKGCRNKDGTIETDEKKMMERWTNHFKTLLNKDCTNETEQEHESSDLNPVEEEVPSTEEVSKVIRNMKNNRAPGEDGIVAELIKCGGNKVQEAIHDILKEVWISETMPDSWNIGVICPIHKGKGDKANCQNYRGI
uniref:Reverse transcriptase n=2 Tax=Cacopsylla melanoneura TaxID=428564 RepID=A0A8D9ANI1_9HEMI